MPTRHSPGSVRSPGEACRMRAARRCNAPSPGSRPCHCVTGRLDGPRSPGVTSRVYHTRRAQRGTSERVDPSSTAASSLHYRPATTALGHAHRHERHGSSSPARARASSGQLHPLSPLPPRTGARVRSSLLQGRVARSQDSASCTAQRRLLHQQGWTQTPAPAHTHQQGGTQGAAQHHDNCLGLRTAPSRQLMPVSP